MSIEVTSIEAASIESMNSLLHKEIPLCEFMQIKVTSLTKASIATVAPLAPNRNMHQTGFAGSQYALAVATGWALAHHRQKQFKLYGLLVVKEATMHYKRPVKGDIELKAELTNETESINIVEELEKNGRACLPIIIGVYSGGKKCAYLEADYVVMPE